MIYRLIFVIMFLLFIGCSKTTVVLLDSGKSQNAVIVSTNGGKTKLDKVGNFVDLKDKENAPSEIKRMSKEEIDSRFSKVLSVSPTKPIKYILYFEPNSIELTEDSKKILSDAIASIEKRSPCMVDVIGHTDSVGSNKTNAKVSLKRAKYIKSIITKKGLKIVSLTAKGYGEEDLLIKTADNISEAKNRNVEVFIK
jgi:outer membrane protein OmpA-like peptidoglycan-associated protein